MFMNPDTGHQHCTHCSLPSPLSYTGDLALLLVQEATDWLQKVSLGFNSDVLRGGLKSLDLGTFGMNLEVVVLTLVDAQESDGIIVLWIRVYAEPERSRVTLAGFNNLSKGSKALRAGPGLEKQLQNAHERV